MWLKRRHNKLHIVLGFVNEMTENGTWNDVCTAHSTSLHGVVQNAEAAIFVHLLNMSVIGVEVHSGKFILHQAGRLSFVAARRKPLCRR